MCGVFESSFQLRSEFSQLVWVHQLLETLEKLALFLADVAAQLPGKGRQRFCGQSAGTRLYKRLAQRGMVSGQLFQQRNQFRELARRGEERGPFRGGMNWDFLCEAPPHFLRPGPP